MFPHRSSLLLSALFILSAVSGAQAEVPANDECSGAMPILQGSNAGDSTGATGAVASFGECDQPIVNDVWYALTCPPGGVARVTVTPTGFFASAALYDACGGDVLSCAQPPGHPSPAVVQTFNDSALE